MTVTDILSYVKTQFSPIQLAQPDATITQNINNVIRYFNVNSAYRMVNMYSLSGTKVIQLDPSYKSVLQVYPSMLSPATGLADPTWNLLGIQVMNYLTTDFIAINEAYKNYAAYFGSDFRFTFEQNPNPSIGGKLYLQNVPSSATSLAVIGAKRILPNEDITSDYLLDVILRGTISQVKITEGNILRKADIINVKNDGQQLLDEGLKEWDEWKLELHANSRWSCLGQRI